LGVFPLLEARRAQLRAERDYVQAQRDFWLAGASFEYLISGGPITDLEQDSDIRQIAPLRIEGVLRAR
jgi:outer membrane protein TolC